MPFQRLHYLYVLLLVLKTKIVGMSLGYPRYSTWKGPTMHLEDLIVTEK